MIRVRAPRMLSKFINGLEYSTEQVKILGGVTPDKAQPTARIISAEPNLDFFDLHVRCTLVQGT